MKTTEKRLRALEERQAMWRRPKEITSRLEVARRVAFVVAQGANAREELEAADASLNPGRRADLTKRLDLARSTASALEKYSPRRETPPRTRHEKFE